MSQNAGRYAIIEAPSTLGLSTTGVERLAERLLQYGLADRLNARSVTRVETLAQKPGRDPATQVLNASAYGPEPLTNLEQRRPLVRAEDTVAFGFRDGEDQREHGSQSPPPEMLTMDLASVRRMGLEHATRAALERVARPELAGFFVHLDADALDDDIMPAVDYRMAGGLSEGEVEYVLHAALATGRVVGLEVTIYNPTLDHDGAAGRALTNVLVGALAPS